MQAKRQDKLEKVLRSLRTILRARESLIKAGVLRSQRDVITDYAEWLAARKFKLKLVESAVNKTYDAIDRKGRKYQIKARRVASVKENTSFDFHNYDRFDYLIAVLVHTKTMKPLLIEKIPFVLVTKYWRQNRSRRSLRWNRQLRALVVRSQSFAS